ncbi:MAG TPA: radical SAM family heme chaperone HemW [Terriglobales bacterium]|nr:radical SAM family heme chaperone HemW [Terriglobales bacterium]
MALGIYVSVPFCRTKCSYCNFASDVFSRAVFGRYVDRVVSDIENSASVAEAMGGNLEREVDSIYLGGGTPTVLDSRLLQRIFVTIRQNFRLQPDAEITVECAPGTLSEPLIEVLQQCGVNRVSLGVQSFVDQEAAAVGRLHKRATILADLARLRLAGITNINIDLIAGLPHQTAESWEFSLNNTIESGVRHASVYMLEIDEESRLGRELIAGGTRYHAHFVPDEELTADLYLGACERLHAAGIEQYEISNFARQGFASRHNLKYWTRQPYLGFGVDAHSMLQARMDPYVVLRDDGKKSLSPGGSGPCALSTCDLDAVRFSTADSVEAFISGAPLTGTPVNRRAALEETFFLGLRLTKGVDLMRTAAQFGSHALERLVVEIDDLVHSGLMVREGDIIRLTARGRLLSNEIFQRFLSIADPA